MRLIYRALAALLPVVAITAGSAAVASASNVYYPNADATWAVQNPGVTWSTAGYGPRSFNNESYNVFMVTVPHCVYQHISSNGNWYDSTCGSNATIGLTFPSLYSMSKCVNTSPGDPSFGGCGTNLVNGLSLSLVPGSGFAEATARVLATTAFPVLTDSASAVPPDAPALDYVIDPATSRHAVGDAGTGVDVALSADHRSVCIVRANADASVAYACSPAAVAASRGLALWSAPDASGAVPFAVLAPGASEASVAGGTLTASGGGVSVGVAQLGATTAVTSGGATIKLPIAFPPGTVAG